MSREKVEIVFSADTRQARAMYEEMAKGGERVTQTTMKMNREFDISNGSILQLATATNVLSKGYDLVTRSITMSIEKQKEFNRLARDRAEGSQSLAIEGGLSARQERAVNANIDAVTFDRAAPSREFVRQVAEELLQVGMSPEQITGGGLESSVRILQAFNEAKPGGSGTQLTRQLVTNMQNLGIPVTPSNMERAAMQFNEIKQLTGLEFGPASNILESMSRIGKSPRNVKALAGLGLSPEQIDPARAGIPGAMQALFDKTAGMSENERASIFARLFGGDEATGLTRMFGKRGELGRSDVGAFRRDADRAISGQAASARRADSAVEIASVGRADMDFETLLKRLEAAELRAGSHPFFIGAQDLFLRGMQATFGDSQTWASGRSMAQSGLDHANRITDQKGITINGELKIRVPGGGTRARGDVKATEHLPRRERYVPPGVTEY